VRVVPNGVAATFTPDGPRADGDYVLAVGTLEPRKNLRRTIDATRRLGIELRIVGDRGWGGVEPGVGWLGRVDDDELARLYRGARCLVYPSLYEGFGIPVAEALACGTPVVTSRDSAMAEVAQGKGVLVDPEDVASIAGGIEEAMQRPVDGFRPPTWDAAAAGTLAVYREAAA
jgi:alpha-1,3-rhamnosyl/mannosyltransferase